MAKNDNLTDFLTDIADAIRTRYDSSELISPQSFVSMVAALGDVSVSTQSYTTLSAFNKDLADILRKCLKIDRLINPQEFHDLILSIPIIDTNKANWRAGDIILYNSQDGSFGTVKQSLFSKGFPKESYYTPVAVTVIPAHHTNDETVRAISLKYMNCSSPANGSTTPQGMYYGPTGGLPYFVDENSNFYGIWAADNFPVMRGATSTFIGGSLAGYQTTDNQDMEGGNIFGHFNESFMDNTISDKGSPEVFYDSAYRNRLRGPAPYAEDGVSVNPDWGWCVSDMDGAGNTWVIVNCRGTLSSNPTYNRASHYPAATCCDRYYTTGTSAGEWYLPAVGELAYIHAYAKKIIRSINLVNPGMIDTESSSDVYLRSSTNASNDTAWTVNLRNGGLIARTKTVGVPVMAFRKF